MQEYKVILTWGAIYDVTDLADNIEEEFDLKRAFPPSIIFYIVKKEKQEVHVLRVLREERDWQNILEREQDYTYPE